MGLFQKLRRRQPGPPKGVVLLYHRIASGQVDPYELCVSSEHFDQQMAVIAERFNPLSINQFVKHLLDRSLPPRAVAVTFDDGYIDNFETAGPILERYEVDATIYMVTGSGGREQEFWWDELERIFLSPGSLPQHLQLDIGGASSTWDLGAMADYSSEHASQHMSWRIPWADVPADRADVPTLRHKVFREVYLLMQAMPASEQQAVLQALRIWAGTERSVRETHRTLELDRLAESIKGTRIAIGAHTIDHPALSSMDYQQQLEQLSGSRDALVAQLSSPITTATYPFGLYSRKTLRAANKCGFDAAFICGDRAVSYGVNPVEIPRVQVPDIEGDALAHMIEQKLSIQPGAEVCV